MCTAATEMESQLCIRTSSIHGEYLYSTFTINLYIHTVDLDVDHREYLGTDISRRS